jgi:hypothetical protein
MDEVVGGFPRTTIAACDRENSVARSDPSKQELRMTLAQATSQEELIDINAVLHDLWFDVTGCQFDHGKSELFVPFPRPVHRDASSRIALSQSVLRENPDSDLALIVGHVRSFELAETEGVGIYDWNEVYYNAHQNILLIRTGIPLKFEITVDAISLTVLLLSPDRYKAGRGD